MMRDSNVSESFRAAAYIIGLLIIAIALFSSCYIVAEAGHDCCGDGCPVCIRIRQFEDSMRILGDCTAALITYALPVFSISAAAFFDAAVFSVTPVSRKIRLNN